MESLLLDDTDVSAPIDDALPTEPKRRGRPPGSKNKTTSSNSPSPARRGRPPRAIRETVTALVGGGNILLRFLSPPDTLNDEEMTVLSAALEAEARNSERIMRWMSRAGTISAHILLIQAIVLIALPRMRRRNLIPQAPPLSPDQEKELNDFMAAYNSAQQNAENPVYRTTAAGTPFSMGTG